jgi:endonuclease/exonuclease/phosphatase (EEP) superfamily protein YafD
VAGSGWKVTSVSWVVAGGLAAWAAARLGAADRPERTQAQLVPVMAFTPQVARIAPWAALGLNLTGRRGAAVTAALAAAGLNAVVRPRRIPRAQPGASGPMVRVLTMNVYFGRADTEVLMSRVRNLGADVLFLQELTEEAVTRLKQAGLDELLPYTRLELRGGSRGSGIYSRFPLSDGPVLTPARSAQPTAVATLPTGEEVELVCVHPAAPGISRWGGPAKWRKELGELPPPDGRPRILAGDFNATLDHVAFREVLRRGYHDAAVQVGNGLAPTWGLPGPWCALDHVLVDRDTAVLGHSVHVVPGSDHRAVYAEVQLPGRDQDA